MDYIYINLVSEILSLVLIIFVGFLISYLRRRKTEEQMALIRDIVEEGVLFAQQVYWHIDGPSRYMAALEAIEKGLQQAGVKVAKDDLAVIIEATVKRLKLEYADIWYDIKK